MKQIDLANPGWSWSRDSQPDVDPAAATATWSCVAGSDYWRLTESGSIVHNGHACTVAVPGDFAIEGLFSADLSSRYDQLGLIAIGDASHWLKAGLELDGQVYAGAVHTRETSDWSLQPAAVPAEMKLARQSETIAVSHRLNADSPWTMIRQLTLGGPVAVGFYAAAPLGPGFRARVTGLTLQVGS